MKKYSSRYNENSERVELDELKTELLSELSENSVQNLSGSRGTQNHSLFAQLSP